MQEDTNFKKLISEVERDLLFQIIINMKHKVISVGESRRLAQDYLALLPFSSKEDLIKNMNALGHKYPEARAVYLKYTIPYLDQEENKLITQMSQYLQNGNIEEALNIVKGQQQPTPKRQLPKIKSTQKESTGDRATGDDPAEKIQSLATGGKGIHGTLEELVSKGIPASLDQKDPNSEQPKEAKANPDKKDKERTKPNESQEIPNKLLQDPEYQIIFGELYSKAKAAGGVNLNQISKKAQDQYYQKMQNVIKDVENDLLTLIINNLKQNSINSNEAKKIAREFLSLLPMQDKHDLLEKLHKLSTNHTQIQELYLKYAKPYEEERQKKLALISEHSKNRQIEPIAKGGTPNAGF